MKKAKYTWTTTDERNAVRSVQAIQAFRKAGRVFTSRTRNGKSAMDSLRDRMVVVIDNFYAEPQIRQALADRGLSGATPATKNLSFFRALEEVGQTTMTIPIFVQEQFLPPDFADTNKAYKAVVRTREISAAFYAAIVAQNFRHGFAAVRREDPGYSYINTIQLPD